MVWSLKNNVTRNGKVKNLAKLEIWPTTTQEMGENMGR